MNERPIPAPRDGAENAGNESLLCDGLPTVPDPGLGTILVTGAGGYIGGRLVPELAARGYRVRRMVRGRAPAGGEQDPRIETIAADALDRGGLAAALEGIGSAYYLIHSMLLGPRRYAEADARAAQNFREEAARAGVRRIIYLGGLGDASPDLSYHLRSRMEVARELRAGAVPVTILRAAIIIGSGSASFEIIKNLVVKLPVILVPRWAGSLCQPIAIRDVIKYLVGVLESDSAAGKTFDIGGPDVLSYRDMMRTAADVLGRRRLFVPFPPASLRAFAYAASLLTPVPAPITISLLGALKNDVVCRDDKIRRLLPFEPLDFRDALEKAVAREDQDRVHTRWSDAYPPAHELAPTLDGSEGLPGYSASYSLETGCAAAALFDSICRIGGREGWFHGNWMWRLRGEFDRLIMGVGTSRGRKRSSGLRVNDVVDFWRVEDIRPNRRLLLRSEMKLPGKAWLEFTIEPLNAKNRLVITAWYRTTTLGGRLYWHLFRPFHEFIFHGLLRQIEKRSRF